MKESKNQGTNLDVSDQAANGPDARTAKSINKNANQ